MVATADLDRHRHGTHVHSHPHAGRHRHALRPLRSRPIDEPPASAHGHAHDDHHHDHHHHGHAHGEHGHSHGLVDPSITRSKEGVKAVAWSLAVLGVAAVAQTAVYLATGSVALLADLIHNYGDALTAVPLGIAFLVGSRAGERLAGLAVVAVIFFSACVAGVEALQRLIHPSPPTHLVALAVAGAIGCAANLVAARIRLRAGERLHSPALVADGHHARADSYVSLGVVASALVTALGAQLADPLIGLVITVVILRVTWQSWVTVRTADAA
jgi:divalent metal cation (Fe/Co/Zn/Cd) transporter